MFDNNISKFHVNAINYACTELKFSIRGPKVDINSDNHCSLRNILGYLRDIDSTWSAQKAEVRAT